VGDHHPRRKLKKVRFYFRLPCEGTQIRHAVIVFRNGRINLEEHTANKVPLQVLAQEFRMSDQRVASCQAFAAAILEKKEEDVFENPVNKYLEGTKAGDFREVACEAIHKRAERWARKKFIDPFCRSIRLREAYVTKEKAEKILEKCTFRTTTTYQHVVKLTSTIGGRTTFKGGSENIHLEKKGKKKSFIKKKSLVNITLNLKKWARAFLWCGGVVEEFSAGNTLRHFVYEVFKIKSSNELYVHIMKQSAGYQLRARKAILRRGHDGVWRIHAWPKTWP
jgi:hypothetical protein